AQLGRNPIVGRAFELDDRVEIVRLGDRVENADERITARNEPAGVDEPDPRQRYVVQFQPPRRPSSRRRVCVSPSMPPSTIKESAGRPPNIGLLLGSFTQRSASASSG